jgi:hypothetical protein
MRRNLLFGLLICGILLAGCKKELSNENKILSFEIPNITNNVFFEGSDIFVYVYRQIDISKLRPMIKVSKGARIYPPSGTMVDFTYPVTYQVIAENGSVANYKVTVSNTLSNQGDIRLFQLVGTEQIFERVRDSIFIYVPYETDITNIQTYIATLDSITIFPTSGTSMDFTTPQTYTTTSTDGTRRRYLVTVKKSPWRWVRNLPYGNRDGAGVVEFKGKMWTLGGWSVPNGPRNNEVWNTSDGIDWVRLPNAPWQARHCAGFVVYKDAMWVISGHGITDVWKSEDGINWTLVTDKAPWGRRYLPYVAVFKDKLWLMGGLNWYDEDGNDIFERGVQAFNDVWSSEDGANWILETPKAAWAPRGLIHGYAVLNDELYIMGGGIKGPTHNSRGDEILSEFNDVWKTKDGKIWIRVVQHAPWKARVHYSLISYNGYIVVLSGSAGTNANFTNDVWISSDGKNWNEIKYSFWQKTHAPTLGGFDNKLWLLGGYSLTDIWSLDFKDL